MQNQRSMRGPSKHGAWLRCPACGEFFWATGTEVERGRRYCQRSCWRAQYGTVEERFWSKVSRSLGCWEWKGTRNNHGYGVFAPVGQKQVAAHRYMWQLVNGPIPDTALVLHACDNKWCVRPDHLFLGSDADNHADMVKKGRQPKGEGRPYSRLTSDDVRTLRRRFAEGTPARQLDREYGLRNSYAMQIVKRHKWKHVD